MAHERAVPQLKFSIFKIQIQNSKVLGASGATKTPILKNKYNYNFNF